MKPITIAYPMWNFGDDFVSRKAYESDLVDFLIDYASVVKLPIEYIEEGYEFEPDPDYLLVNIDTSGLKLFLLREQGKIDTPFLIHFHVIFSQHIFISYLLPLLRKEDVIVVGSRYSRNCLLKISAFFDVPVIPLALDVERIAAIADSESARGGKKAGQKNIVYMGQLIKEKGIGELIECMPGIIADAGPEVSLTVIGPLSGTNISGEMSDFVAQLQQRAGELGIAQHIRWTGVLMGEEKYRLLSGADVFVNPSVFKIETFGVVNTEALACGLPVVCANWSAFSEIIQDGKNGFSVEVRPDELDEFAFALDRRQLIERVSRLLNDESLLAAMKQEARRSADAYHYRIVMPQLMNLLKKKETHYQGQWESIAQKSFINFRHLFRPLWLEVIHADHIAYKTYEEMTKINNPGIKFPALLRHEAFRYLSGR